MKVISKVTLDFKKKSHLRANNGMDTVLFGVMI